MGRSYLAVLVLIVALSLLVSSCWSAPESSGTPSPFAVATVTPAPTAAAQAGTPAARLASPTIAAGTPPASRACPNPVTGGFAAAYDSTPQISERLGCPTSTASNIPAAGQEFQNGTMFWQGDLKRIYVLYGAGEWTMYPDTFKDGDQESGGETPPSGLYEPVRGFGKVWREQPAVRTKLGWATGKERGFQGSIQPFAHGSMLSDGRPVIYILFDDGTWQKGASSAQ